MKGILTGLVLVLPTWAVLGYTIVTGTPFVPAAVAIIATVIVTTCATGWLFATYERKTVPVPSTYRLLHGQTDLLADGDARGWLPADPREGWYITANGTGLYAVDGDTVYLATPNPCSPTPHEVHP